MGGARRRLGAKALAAAALLLAVGATRPAGASSALELVRIARAHEQAREEDVALRRYMEALSLDASCAEAYLGLGALRARRGDLREAERVYTVALERIADLGEARTARAYVRRALGMREESVSDLLAGAGDELAALRALASWHGEDGQVPAQLAVWRRISARAEAAGDAVLAREARTMIRALVILVGPADPAAAPGDARGLRGVLAALARRGG